MCEFPAQMASNAESVSIWWRHQASYAEASWTNNVSHSYVTFRAYMR